MKPDDERLVDPHDVCSQLVTWARSAPNVCSADQILAALDKDSSKYAVFALLCAVVDRALGVSPDTPGCLMVDHWRDDYDDPDKVTVEMFECAVRVVEGAERIVVDRKFNDLGPNAGTW